MHWAKLMEFVLFTVLRNIARFVRSETCNSTHHGAPMFVEKKQAKECNLEIKVTSKEPNVSHRMSSVFLSLSLVHSFLLHQHHHHHRIMYLCSTRQSQLYRKMSGQTTWQPETNTNYYGWLCCRCTEFIVTFYSFSLVSRHQTRCKPTRSVDSNEIYTVHKRDQFFTSFFSMEKIKVKIVKIDAHGAYKMLMNSVAETKREYDWSTYELRANHFTLLCDLENYILPKTWKRIICGVAHPSETNSERERERRRDKDRERAKE